MAQGQWQDYTSNDLFGTGTPTDQDHDVLLDRSQRYIINRRNGPRVWLPHKCINCGASIQHCISWTRRFYHLYGRYVMRPTDVEPVEFSDLIRKEQGDIDWNEKFDIRFFEQCTKCRRVMSWEYVGVAPRGWKAPAMPLCTRMKDVQRRRVYQWEASYVDSTPAGQMLPTWEETEQYVHSLFDSYNMLRCELVKGVKGVENSSWMKGRSKMKLLADTQHQSKATAIHEFAHAVLYALWEQKIGERRVAAHGALYMAVYISLLAEFEHMSTTILLNSAQSRKLQVENLEVARDLLAQLRAKGAKTVAQDEDEEEVDSE